ncbi:MAG: hypothetical protein OES09_02790 [Gammaproteobacteria bacterium]|nr:hypothetical protein [Gammaproteobacteria bacterium]
MTITVHLDHDFTVTGQGSWVTKAGAPDYGGSGNPMVCSGADEAYYELPIATLDAETPDKAYQIYIDVKCVGDSQLRLRVTNVTNGFLYEPLRIVNDWPYGRLNATSWGAVSGAFGVCDKNEGGYTTNIRFHLMNKGPAGETVSGSVEISRVIILLATDIEAAEWSNQFYPISGQEWPTPVAGAATLTKGAWLGTMADAFYGNNESLYVQANSRARTVGGGDRSLLGHIFSTLSSTFPFTVLRGPGAGSPGLLHHLTQGTWDETEKAAHVEAYSGTSYWSNFGPGILDLEPRDYTLIAPNVPTIITDLNIVDADKYGPRPYSAHRGAGEYRDSIASLFAQGFTNIIAEFGNENYRQTDWGTGLLGYNPTHPVDVTAGADAEAAVTAYIERVIAGVKDLRGYSWPAPLKFAIVLSFPHEIDREVWSTRLQEAMAGTHAKYDLRPFIDYVAWHNYNSRPFAVAASQVNDEWWYNEIINRTAAKIDLINTEFGVPAIITECGDVNTSKHMRLEGGSIRTTEIMMALENDTYIRKHLEGKLPYLCWHGLLQRHMGVWRDEGHVLGSMLYSRSTRFHSATARTIEHGQPCHDGAMSGADAADMVGLIFDNAGTERAILINRGAKDVVVTLPSGLQSKPYEATDPDVLGFVTPPGSPSYLTGTTGASNVTVEAQSIMWVNPAAI